jgi:hypothetical protein
VGSIGDILWWIGVSPALTAGMSPALTLGAVPEVAGGWVGDGAVSESRAGGGSGSGGLG